MPCRRRRRAVRQARARRVHKSLHNYEWRARCSSLCVCRFKQYYYSGDLLRGRSYDTRESCASSYAHDPRVVVRSHPPQCDDAGLYLYICRIYVTVRNKPNMFATIYASKTARPAHNCCVCVSFTQKSYVVVVLVLMLPTKQTLYTSTNKTRI